MDNTAQSITQKAIKNTKWVFLSTIFSKIWQPIVTLILARLLTPADFGLMALATIVISFLSIFQDLGLSAALIQRKDRIKEAANVVFWTNIVVGIIWYTGVFITAPFVAIFFNHKGVTDVLRVIGLIFLLHPLGSVHGAFMIKSLHFKKLFYLALLPTIIPGILSIVLAYMNLGVWSLVYGVITGTVLNVSLLWFTSNWRPGFQYKWKMAREMFHFGGYVSLESIMGWGIGMMDNVFVGRYIGSIQLGIYNMGFRLAHWPSENITGTLTKILYPTFSELQQDESELKKVYLKVVKIISLITFPIGAIIAITADEFISIFLGEKWLLAIPVVQILSIWGILSSVMSINSSLYKAVGRPDIYPKFFFVRLLVSIPVYYYSVKYGIIALCYAHLALVFIFAPINYYIGIKVLNISSRIMNDILKTPLIYTIIIGSFTLLVKYYMERVAHLSDLVVFPVEVLVFISGYLLSLYLLNKQIIVELKGILKLTMA